MKEQFRPNTIPTLPSHEQQRRQHLRDLAYIGANAQIGGKETRIVPVKKQRRKGYHQLHKHGKTKQR